jgi:hypothetical protein
MTVSSNRDEVRQAIEDGGWEIIWGDVIDEFDAVTFLVSLPTGTVGAWVAEQVEVQLLKFTQSSGEVSLDVLRHATAIVQDIMRGHRLGKWDINGLEVKGGIATYHRWWQFRIGRFHLGGKRRIPNNYQPYIGLRVAQPLPPKGTSATPRPVRQTDLTTDEAKLEPSLRESECQPHPPKQVHY